MRDPQHGTPPAPRNNRSLDQTAEFYQDAFVVERGARLELKGAVKQVEATNQELRAECDRQADERQKILEDGKTSETESAKPWYKKLWKRKEK